MFKNSEYIQENIVSYENQLIQCYKILELHEKGILIPNSAKGKESLAKNTSLLKFTCFSLSCFLDISTSLKGITNFQSNWEKVFFLRNSFVTIRESIKTYHEYQKEIRELISENLNCRESLEKLNLKLKKFKTEYNFESSIIPFRNKAGAHYDKNFSIYFDKLNEINDPKSIETILAFSNFQTALISFLDEVIDYMVEESNTNN